MIVIAFGWISVALVLFSFVTRYLRLRSRKPNPHTDAYFPPNDAKLQYDELIEQYSPHDAFGLRVLRSALLRRALVDVQRIMKLREEKGPLQNLVRSGVVGEEMMEKIVAAEKELEVEVPEVVEDADLYKPDWGKNIFQEATALYQIQMQALAQQRQQHQTAALQQQLSSASANVAKKENAKMGGAKIEELADDAAEAAVVGEEETPEEKAKRVARELIEEEERERVKAEQRAKSKAGAKKAAGGGKKK
ncbi:translocation protein S66 [Chytridiales sp. JEL 0842]|nr:translocation protein S66 [Chytridiales sp. JEL 0842]